MSTRSTWSHELAERARTAGWRVIKPRSLGGAYKVYMSPCDQATCNHILQLHLTSSDMNAHRVAEREMIAHGLIGLEVKAEKNRAAERAARLEADRRDAERKAAETEKQSAAIRRAAGGPEYVPNSWFTAQYPAPVTRKVMMTPAQAQWLFDNFNTSNRPFYRHTRDDYYNIIKAGKWRLTHQGCAMDWNGVLQDGQHRLSAITKAGVDVPILFSCGMDPDNFKAIDTPMQRTSAQLLSKEGHSSTRHLAAVIKLIWVFDCDDRARARDKLTNDQIFDSLGADKDAITASVAAGIRLYGVNKTRTTGVNATALSAAHYLLTRANGPDNPYVAAFLDGLAHERKALDRRLALDEYDPRVKLRNYLGNARANRKNVKALDQLCLTVITWNHVVGGRRREYLRWAPNQPIPRITTIAPGSRCPMWLEGEVAEENLLTVAA